MDSKSPLLEIEDLSIGYRSSQGIKWVVRDFSLVLWPGEKLALMGPSGIGKTTIALAILGLLPGNAVVKGGIYFDREKLTSRTVRALRGDRIGIVFQHPHAYLNPLMTAEEIVSEVLVVKRGLSKKQALEKARQALCDVGLNEKSFQKYPFQLSGGMAQRVAIAQTIVLEPDLLIGDEITSALDIDLRNEILDIVRKMVERLHLSFLFISHDEKAVEYLGCRRIYLGSGKSS